MYRLPENKLRNAVIYIHFAAQETWTGISKSGSLVQLVDAKCVTCIHIRSLTAVQVYVEGKKFMS